MIDGRIPSNSMIQPRTADSEQLLELLSESKILLAGLNRRSSFGRWPFQDYFVDFQILYAMTSHTGDRR